MRRSCWIIWFCMALLPMRGMAQAGMLLAGMSTPPGIAAAAEVAPCHMSALAPAADVADDADEAMESAPQAGTCQLCAVCHSAALAAFALADPAAPVPALTPRFSAGLGAGLDGPDGLFRPPR